MEQTKLNSALISFVCAFMVSFGITVLLSLVGTEPRTMAPIFVVGAVVLSYFFYRVHDIKLILVYSFLAIGLLFVLFPAFVYLGIPRSLPGYEIKITSEQAVLISIATGASALVLAIALKNSPLKSR